MSLRGYLFLKLYTAKSAVTSMPKTPRVRILMGSQHAKASKTLLNCPRQDFCHIFDSSERKISSENCALVVSEIFKLLTPDEKSSLSAQASV